jgi:SPP1 family predicted phage head-tail adaptor
MQASKYRHRVAFEQRAVTSDGHGNIEGDFAPEFQVSARIRPRLGGESVIAARLQGTSVVNVFVRYSQQTAQVTTEWRARNVKTGEIYNIKSIIEDDEGKHRELEMLCEVGHDNG